ncbi:hypothetical protein ACIBCM_10310 [Streptomyces sp. NPDC051018]|uniref:hypothetical protein n=1 Tax=Streptomyces sp. NPDC051018 TaxID=3365639 RepID=UPI003798827D
MTRIPLPGQAAGETDRHRGRPPVRPAVSEATRYLCAGTHLDDRYRTAVINELYVHEERFTAPSFGIDAGRVLAHALLARRHEVGWAFGALVLWVLAIPLTHGLSLYLLIPSLLLSLFSWAHVRLRGAPVIIRAIAFGLRWYLRLTLGTMLLYMLAAGFAGLFDDDEEQAAADPYAEEWDYPAETATSGEDGIAGFLQPLSASGGSAESGRALLAVFLFFLVTSLVALRRGQFARLMAGPLSRAHFPDAASDPAEVTLGHRARRLVALVRREQHSPLVMYHAANPFRGAGDAFRTWTLAVELRPRRDHRPESVDNRTILEHIRPLVEALRVPSSHGSPEAADAVRDRLRELLIDECVFLPAEGIPARDSAPYDQDGFAEQCREAVEEGGEARRHFLRIRVGGWDEEVVVTVFVRVHTQGGMLMLEVAPHVLLPVHSRFRDAERTAHRYAKNSAIGKLAWALTHTPRSAGQSIVTIGRWAVSGWERLTGGNRNALPDGPALSVREYAADSDGSLFQEMDVLRYLKSIEDRVTAGVKRALYEAGWQTDEFEQRIINVSGGVYIDSANNSAFGFGDHSSATTRNTSITTRGNTTRNTTKGAGHGKK